MKYDLYTLDASLPIILAIFVYILIRVTIILKHKKINMVEEVPKLLLTIYIALLVGVTLFPIDIAVGNKGFIPSMYEKPFPVVFNINPFNFYGLLNTGFHNILRNIGGNLIMMTPYSILLAFNFRSMRRWIPNIFVILLTSIGIEILQYFWQISQFDISRKTDINDVIQNTIGAVIGFMLYQYAFSNIPIFKKFIVRDKKMANVKDKSLKEYYS